MGYFIAHRSGRGSLPLIALFMGIYDVKQKYRRQNYRRIVRAAIFVLIAAGFALPCASPARAQYEAEMYADELILQVIKSPYMLSEGIFAYQDDTRYYLPLTEMSEMLGFVIDAEAGRGYASGWFLDESNSYSVDIQRLELVMQGARSTLGQDDFYIDEYNPEEIYLEIGVLNRLWPVSFNVDLSNLQLVIETEEPLPFERALEREGRRLMASRRQAPIPASERTDLPLRPNPYKLFSLPFIDLDQQLSWNENQGQISGQTGINVAHDLAGTAARYSGTLNLRDGALHRPSAIRMQLERKAFGDDTMPFGVRQILGGDATARLPDLVASGVSGRGVQISTEPVERRVTFDQVVIEGFSLPGYEVELYRNDQLLDFGTVDSTGLYRFENVPLNVGNNVIRVMLYGPQGQTEERIETHQITGGFLSPGDSSLQAQIVDSGRPFILLDRDAVSSAPEGVAKNMYGAYGINTNVTGFATYSQFPMRNDEDGRYASVGAMLSAFGSYGQVQLYNQLGGGSAVDARFATNLRGLRLNSRASFYRDFESPDAGFGASARRFLGELRATTNLPTALGSLGLQLDTQYIRRVNNTSTTRIATQQSIGRGGLRVNHSTTTQLMNNEHQSTTAAAGVTVRNREWQLRTGLNYAIYPLLEVSSGTAELRYNARDSFTAAVNLQHNFLSQSTSAGFQLGYDFDTFLGSLNTRWDQDNGFDVTVRASSSLAPLGVGDRYIASSRKMTTSAVIKARVFLDHDGDGVFSEGDEPIEDARLLIGGRGGADGSGPDGIYVSRNISQEGLTTVEVDKGSLYDPYYRPGDPGYRTIVRQGSVLHFDFPIIESGAVDGTVYYETTGRPVPGMRLQLVDATTGQVAMTAETAFDGFYSFEFVPPGDYTVRADPEYQVNVPPEEISVTSEDLFVFGIDLYLLEQAGEAERADAAHENMLFSSDPWEDDSWEEEEEAAL